MKALFVTAAALSAMTAHALTPKAPVMCKTEVREHSGSREALGRCRPDATVVAVRGEWACYREMVERCTESSGRLTQREFRQWTGACVATVEECGKAPIPQHVANMIPAAVTLASTSVSEAEKRWACEDVDVEKASHLDVEHGVCGRNGVTASATPWACYAVVLRKCREPYSGKARTTREKRFLGCYESFSDCR